MWLHSYYRKAIFSTEELELYDSLKVKDWIGPFKPKSIDVILLIEDFGSILTIDRTVGSYIDE